MKFIVLSIFFLSSFSMLNIANEGNVYEIGEEIKLIFRNASECGCEESCSFSKSLDENTFEFSIPTNFNTGHTVKVKSEFDYDSLFVYQREIYCYGLIISETEGIIFFQGDSLNSTNISTKKSTWHFIPLNKNKEFTILDKYESKSYPKMAPTINKNKVELELTKRFNYANRSVEDQLKEYQKNKRFGVFVSKIEIRLKYYINGEIKRYSLWFPYRHGEC